MQAEIYSYCETVTASGATPWHIRKLTSVGRKLGGGADTPALCGRKVAWDLEVPVLTSSKTFRDTACKKCVEAFGERTR
jgi:hypothetical protein